MAAATIFPELENAIHKLLSAVNRKIHQEKSSIIKMLESFNWITKSINDVDECVAVGVDSSFILVETRIGMIYIIQGIAVRHSFNKSTIKVEDYSRFHDVGLISIKPDSSSKIVRKPLYKRVLSAYAYLLELQSAHKLIVNSTSTDVLLLDGSLLSFVMQKEFKNVSVVVNSANQNLDIEIKDVLRKKIELVNELAKTTHTVFLAKSSGAGFYTNGVYPDIYVLELAKLFRIEPYYRTGYSTPMAVEIDGTLKRFLGTEYPHGIQYITITYSRLADNAPIYQLTLPNRIDTATIDDIFSRLRILSPSGYPIPLEYPHRVSKLPRSIVIDVFVKLGIPVISGRELIEL